MDEALAKKHPRRRRGRRGRKRKNALAVSTTSPTSTTDKVASLRKRLQAIKGRSVPT